MVEVATAKKRGRPPKPESEKTRGNITFRSRPGTREQLEASAAKHRRSLSEEVEARLVQSFNYDGVYEAVDDGFRRNLRMFFGVHNENDSPLIMIHLASYLKRAFTTADRNFKNDLKWYEDPQKERDVEDNFIHGAQQILRSVAQELRNEAAERAERAAQQEQE